MSTLKSPLTKSQQDILRDNILTASKEDLTLMLYEGCLKFINQALMAIESKEMEKAHTLCMKAQAIILEFRATLDVGYEVAQQMDPLYVYIYELLVEGNMGKDIAKLSEARDLVRSFRDTWKEAIVVARREGAFDKDGILSPEAVAKREATAKKEAAAQIEAAVNKEAAAKKDGVVKRL